MHKQFAITSILLSVTNYFYLIFIFLNLVNCLFAKPMNKNWEKKCNSIAYSSEQLEQSEHELSRDWLHLAKQLALNQSLKVFGLKKSGFSNRRRHNSAPEYMLDLYSMVANTAEDNPINLKYNANAIRSVTHSDTSDTSTHLHFYFNLSQLIDPSEQIIEAEFHIYKLRTEPKVFETRKDPKHNLLEVKVYQMLSKESTGKKRLLDVRRMSTNSFGWDVFYVKTAVLDWTRDHSSNYGLLITVTTLLGESVRNGIRVSNRYRNHINKQPLIVIFSSDQKLNSSFTKSNQYISKYDYGFSELSANKNDSNNEPKGLISLEKQEKHLFIVSNSRPSSASTTSSSQPLNVCSRRELYIDLKSIESSASIISPNGYKTHICIGKCINPVNRNSFAKSHTTLRYALFDDYYSSEYRVKSCCVPNKFNPLIVLYFDERGNVVLKRFDDLLVRSCGCG